MDSLSQIDPVGWASTRTLLAGYDAATAWWASAVTWLLTRPWVERPDGSMSSPAALVAAFWDRGELTLPIIEPMRFGSVQAVPVLGGDRLGSRLVRPANASAAEWLGRGGVSETLALWRGIDAGDALTLDTGGRGLRVTAPATLARGRLGGFLSSVDAIRIEPGMMPLFAVATRCRVAHLLFEAARLEGPAFWLRDEGRNCGSSSRIRDGRGDGRVVH